MGRIIEYLPVVNSKIPNPNNPAQTLQFISDTHSGAISASRLDAITNDTPITPHKIIHVGDQTDDATGPQDTAAIAFLDGLPADWYAVCGNHDLLGPRTPADWATAYSMAGQNYVVDLTFCQVIFLGANDSASPHTLDAAALTFLETSLNNAGVVPCIIVTHFPMHNTTLSSDPARYYSSITNVWYLKDKAAIWTILEAYDNAVAWVSGHLHAPYFAPNFVKSQQVGTHQMAFINASSPYYTDYVAGETASAVVSVYVMLTATGLGIYVRDHLAKRWLRRYGFSFATGLTEATPLLSDQFTTAAAAPIGIRSSEPGPGKIEVVDTNSIISLASGTAVINGTPLASEGIVFMDIVGRHCGRAMRFDVPVRTTVASQSYMGLSTTRLGATINIGFDYTSTTTIRAKNGTTALATITVGPNSHSFIFAMRGTGGILLARDSGDPANVYTISHIYGIGTAALYANIRLPAAALDFTVDNLWIGTLTGGFATEFGLATVYDDVTIDNQTAVGAAGGWFEHTITAQAGVTQELMFRRQDDDNTWIVRMDQGASTITLISKQLGVETVRGGPVAFTWTNGTKYRVLAYTNASFTQRVFVDDVYIVGGSSTVLNSNTGIKVSHAGEKLAFWPLTVTVS